MVNRQNGSCQLKRIGADRSEHAGDRARNFVHKLYKNKGHTSLVATSQAKNAKRGRPGKSEASAEIRRICRALRLPAGLYTYRQIAAALSERSGIRVTAPTVRRYAAGIEPTRPHLRQALGLPALALAPACATCGVVHTSKHCPKARPARVPRSLFDWPAALLRLALANREEVK